MVKRWVFKWGELQAGSTQSSTLMASSEFFAHSAYLGREAEFFPAGEQPLKGKLLPDSTRRGCVCPWEQVSKLCLKTLLSRELWALGHEQDSL